LGRTESLARRVRDRGRDWFGDGGILVGAGVVNG